VKSLLMYCCAILAAYASMLHAQEVPSALEVMQGFVRNVADTLSVVAGRDADTLRVRIHNHPDALWFESIIAQHCDEQHIPMRIVSNDEQSVTLVISDASTTYQPHSNADSVVREVVLDASLRSSTAIYKLQKQSRRDIVAHDLAMVKQSDQHASTTAVIPVKHPSLWDDILQPIVFIGAAVVTIVLLFTVRSQ